MVKITPNCFQCAHLSKQESISQCGYLIFFKCVRIDGVRIYGNPELIICDRFLEKEGSK